MKSDLLSNINFNSIPQAFHRDSSLEKYLLIFVLEKFHLKMVLEVISEYKLNGKNFIDMLIARFNYGSYLVDMNPGDLLFRYSSTWHRGTKTILNTQDLSLFNWFKSRKSKQTKYQI